MHTWGVHHVYWLAAVGLLFAALLAKLKPQGRRPALYRDTSA